MDDAIKYGKPIVAFRVGALGEMIEDKGVLVEDVSAEALTKAIEKRLVSIMQANENKGAS